jgi:serine phosphatase RsbU (regulator of sigma subunit)
VTDGDDDRERASRLDGTEGALGWTVEAGLRLAPDEVSDLLTEAASRLGAGDALLYLADIDQRLLVPLGRGGVGGTDLLDIDSTLAGRAFQTGQITAAGGGRAWFPVIDGSERLGVLRLGFADLDEGAATAGGQLASLVAGLVVAKGRYGDVFQEVRRQRPLNLAAELQGQLMPPLTFSTSRVSVAGVLEPAYEVAGDCFDYALNGDILTAAIFDSVGHDVSSAVVTTVAVGAYRHARRRRIDLEGTAGEVDEALRSQFQDMSFVTAALVELDVATGALRWLNAGHPRPLLLRGGRVVRTLACSPRPPLGIPRADPEIGREQLEPGDALLLFTDGVVEARSALGEGFGFDRLGDFFHRAAASHLAPAETMRRLVRDVVTHHGGGLQDDATCLLIEWPVAPSHPDGTPGRSGRQPGRRR